MPDPTGWVSHEPIFHRGVSWKQPVRVASTGNVALATAVENGDTIDGVVLATGDRVLLKDQTAGIENGIYEVQASGPPLRAFDMDQDATFLVPASEVIGAVVLVTSGTANAGTLWRNTNTTLPMLGTDALTFGQIVTAGGTGSTFADLGWFNVEDYGAVHDGTTDDTSSIQDAIDACAAAGGGTIYFPAGIYQIDGALRDTGTFNSQLEIPTNSSAPDYAIRFLGSGPVNPNPDEPNEMGSVLRSSWNGTISGNPAIISAGSHDSLAANRVFVHFEQIEIRAHEDPKLTAIDMTNAKACRWDQLVVSVSWSTPFAVPNTWSVPTHSNAVGVDMPWGLLSQPFDGGGTVYIVGYYTGIRPSEQCAADQIVVSFCTRALDFRGQVGSSAFLRHACYVGRIETFWCPRSIVFSGDERWVNIGQIDIEHSLSPFTQVYDIDDASNYGRGFIPWHVTDWTTGPVATLTVNGGSGLSLFGAYAKQWKLNNVVDIPTGTNPSTNPANGRRLYTDSSTGHLSSRDSSGTVFDYETAAALTIKDEGSALSTAATSIDFVGAGVVASGTTAAKTVTVSGAPAGAAGGDLSGTYPNPTVAKINGVTVSGTPSTGQEIVATGTTTASWQTVSSGGIGEILISDSPSTPLVFADLIQNEAQDDLVYADP